jgi:hypothetical protein
MPGLKRTNNPIDRVNRTRSDIEFAASDAVRAIASAAQDAVKVLANATSEATKVVANNAAEALKVSNSGNANDHDLLIRLETKMTDLKEDIKDIKDGTTAKINDHEIRLNGLETSKTKQTTLLSIGVGILVILTTLLVYHLFQIQLS